MAIEQEHVEIEHLNWYRASWKVTAWGIIWIDYFKVKSDQDSSEQEWYCRSRTGINNKVTLHQMPCPFDIAFKKKRTTFPKESTLVLQSERIGYHLSIEYAAPVKLNFFYIIPIKVFTPNFMRFSYQGHPVVLCKPSPTKWFHTDLEVEARVLLKGYEAYVLNPKEGQTYLVLWTHRLSKRSLWYFLFKQSKVSYFSIHQTTINYLYSNPLSEVLEVKDAYNQLKEIHVDPSQLEFWCFASLMNYYIEAQKLIQFTLSMSIFFIGTGLVCLVLTLMKYL